MPLIDLIKVRYFSAGADSDNSLEVKWDKLLNIFQECDTIKKNQTLFEEFKKS